MINKLIKALKLKKRKHRLTSDIAVPFDMTRQDIQIIFALMSLKVLRHARDPYGVRRLMKRYNVSTAAALIAAVPAPRRASLKERFVRFMCRLEGSSYTNRWSQ